MIAKTPIAATIAETVAPTIADIEQGLRSGARALPPVPDARSRTAKPLAKVKPTQAATDDQVAPSDNSGEAAVGVNSVALAQAATESDKRSDVADVQSGTSESVDDAKSDDGAIRRQIESNVVGSGLSGLAAPGDGATPSEAAGGDTAVVASGLPALWALPLLGLGGGGGGSGGSAPAPAATPTPVTPLIKGAVADGYIAGAKIYTDVNGNGKPDLTEDTGVVTDSTGHYSLPSTVQGSIIAVGGTNIDTGLPNTMVLMAPAGSTVVNPLTTLVVQYVNSKGVSVAAAEAAIEAKLTLPSVDLQNYDPLATTNPTDVTALAVQKVEAQLAVVIGLTEKFHPGFESAMLQSIVDLIVSGQTVNLGAVATLSAINANAGSPLSAAQLSNIAAGTAAIAQDSTLDPTAANSISHTQHIIMNVVTVAEAGVLLQRDPTAQFNLFDTAENLLAAPVATIQAAAGGVTVSDVPVLSIAQATALLSVDHAAMSFTISDSAQALAGAAPSVTGAANSITVTVAAPQSPTTVSLTEADTAAALSTSGALTSTAAFVVQGATAGSYGTFTIGAGGAWNYTASSAHNEFVAGT
ncbi:MAG: VCBS domain-containing protein, partial [Comamonadaceae bacterium]